MPWRAVLTYRYLESLSWADVAKATDYSEAYCKREVHSNALLELYEHIPHDELPCVL